MRGAGFGTATAAFKIKVAVEERLVHSDNPQCSGDPETLIFDFQETAGLTHRSRPVSVWHGNNHHRFIRDAEVVSDRFPVEMVLNVLVIKP